MSRIDEIKEEIDKLALQGHGLYCRMLFELPAISEEIKKQIEKSEYPFVDQRFSKNYEGWYTRSLKVIRQIAPEREGDFTIQYRDAKRKEISFGTYTISDYLMGLTVTRGGETKVDISAAVPKIEAQKEIIQGIAELAKSKLMDIEAVIGSDLFDSEVDAAENLAKRGYFRASGAMLGVVLERHLAAVAKTHGFQSRKRNPTISDFNDHLRNVEIIGIPEWRRIQHLADLRNLCDHPKEREPTKDDALELAEGVRKTLKTVT